MRRSFHFASQCSVLVATLQANGYAQPAPSSVPVPPIPTIQSTGPASYPTLLAAAQQAQQRANLEPIAAKQAAYWQQAALQFAAIIKLGATITPTQRCSAGADMIAAIQAAMQRERNEPGLTTTLNVTAGPERSLSLSAAVQQRIAMLHLYDTLDSCSEQTTTLALDLLLDLYNRTGQYAQLAQIAQRTLTNPARATLPNQTIARLRTILAITQRKHAELLERSAKQTGAWTTFDECGDAYLQIFNQPTYDGGATDEVLYNAAVCYETGHSIGKAIGVYQQLRASFPQSQLAARALVRLASSYAAVANFPKAAENLEMYARQHSGEKAALDAMSTAYYYRSHTGADAKAIADAHALIKNYGNQRLSEIADVKFALAALYEKRGDKVAALANLQAYVAQTRRVGNQPANDIVAYAKIGELLWAQSCPIPTTDGACVKILPVSRIVSCESRRPKQPQQRYIRVARDPKKVTQAMAAFAAARQRFDRLQPSTSSSDDLAAHATARYYNALARRMAAEPAFEQLLTTPFPTGLNFDAANPKLAKQAQRRFDAWMQLVTDGNQNLRTLYQEIITLKDPIATVAVAARLGQLDANVANALQRGDIPAAFRAGPYGEEKVVAFCEVMAAEAAPFQASARQAFDMCAAKARELTLHNEWTTLCHRELNRIDPTLAPPQHERQAAPTANDAVITTELPQLAPPASSNEAPAVTPTSTP